MRISDWSSDVCSSDLRGHAPRENYRGGGLMAGKYFDEWTVGERIQHEIRRTVTETDNLLMSTLTHNPQPLHLDIEAARASEFGQILVNGTFTFALMVGLSVGDTTDRKSTRLNSSH